MTDRSRPAHTVGLPPHLTTAGLSAQQRRLIDLMREHRFGRIENMRVRDQEPILDRDVRIVRVARLGGEDGGAKVPQAEEFELNRATLDLFDELARLGTGMVTRLEFKRGLPCLLETVRMIDIESGISV